MKRIPAIFAALPLLALAATAQDWPAAQVKMMGIQGAVMGKTIKNAPYSGTEVSETTQVLADGTRIHNEFQTQVWRDSEGRVRREGPGGITIFDPVANASYVLNPKTQTARKLPLGMYLFSTSEGGNTMIRYFRFSTGDGVANAERRTAELRTTYGPNHPAVREAVTAELKARAALETEMKAAPGKVTTEQLPKRTIEGVAAEGSRETSIIDTGAIGNDRPIQIVNERWFSPELQTVLQSRHSDPRTGEESFKLINISRAEPPAYFFQIPAGYRVITDEPPRP